MTTQEAVMYLAAMQYKTGAILDALAEADYAGLAALGEVVITATDAGYAIKIKG